MATIRIVRELLPPGWHVQRADEVRGGAACARRRRLALATYAAIGLGLGLILWIITLGLLVATLYGVVVAALAAWVALAWLAPPRFSIARELHLELVHESVAFSLLFVPGIVLGGGGVPLVLLVQMRDRLMQYGVGEEALLYVAAMMGMGFVAALFGAWVAYRAVRAMRVAKKVLTPGEVVWAFGSTWNAARFLNVVCRDGSRHSIQLAGDVALATGLRQLETLGASALSEYRAAPPAPPFVGWTREAQAAWGDPPGLAGRRN